MEELFQQNQNNLSTSPQAPILFTSSKAKDYEAIFVTEFNKNIFKLIKSAFEKLKLELFGRDNKNLKDAIEGAFPSFNAPWKSTSVHEDELQWEFWLVKYLKKCHFYYLNSESRSWSQINFYNKANYKQFSKSALVYYHYKCLLEAFYDCNSFSDCVLYFYKNCFDYINLSLKEDPEERFDKIKNDFNKCEKFYSMCFFDSLVRLRGIHGLQMNEKLNYVYFKSKFSNFTDVVENNIKSKLMELESTSLKMFTHQMLGHDKYHLLGYDIQNKKKLYDEMEVETIIRQFTSKQNLFIYPLIITKMWENENISFSDHFNKHVKMKKKYVNSKMKIFDPEAEY